MNALNCECNSIQIVIPARKEISCEISPDDPGKLKIKEMARSFFPCNDEMAHSCACQKDWLHILSRKIDVQ